MSAPNQMAGPWFPSRWETAEACRADNPPGEIICGNYLPYIAKRVDVQVRRHGQTYQWREVVVPLPLEELHAYWERTGTYTADSQEGEQERRALEANRVAAELWHESWVRGVPADATIFCQACYAERPAHGSNYYDATLVCNKCVRDLERAMAYNQVQAAEAWVQERAAASRLNQAISEVEKRGEGCFPLPGEHHWLEVRVLYQFTRHSAYSTESEEKSSWPYPDMMPVMYQGYERSGWDPGQNFNAPETSIYFTSGSKLFDYLHSGGELPPGASSHPQRDPGR